MDEEFFEKFRKSMLEEMSLAINNINNIVFAEEDVDLSILSYNTGYLTSLFKQLYALETKEEPPQKEIGFK